MAIYNRRISMMLVAAYSRLKASGDVAHEELSIHDGIKDSGMLSLKAKLSGAVIRTYWFHNGCRVKKHEAVRIMRNHEQVERSLTKEGNHDQ